MPTYVLPQVLVFQDFTIAPSVAANPLRAHISGGHAYLVRYAQTDEREFGRLGYYDGALDTEYSWPNRPVGGIIDQSYTKLWMKDALLQYFHMETSGSHSITKVANYNNRLNLASLNIAENGTLYPRDAEFLDRDVAVGDVAKVRCFPPAADPVTVWTYVKEIVGDIVAGSATDGDITPDASNADTVGSSTSTIEQVDGDLNCMLPTVDMSSYDGTIDGSIQETYRLIVTEGSVAGDLSVARLRVISGSGLDDDSDVVVSDVGVATDIGTRGLKVTFTAGGDSKYSESAENEGIGADDLVVGQTWLVTLSQVFTAPVMTLGASSEYTSDHDTTYIVEVTRGGLMSTTDSPQISVSTTNGIDMSGPTNITAAGTEVAAGTYGVTVKFAGTKLRKGDRYYIDATGETVGPIRNIVLANNLPVEAVAGSEVALTLFIRKPLLQITSDGDAPMINWSSSDNALTVYGGILAYDETWTDDGVPQALEVVSQEDLYGLLYVEYRAWIQTLCGDVNGIYDVGELNTQIEGSLHPDNPLKWGVFKALENANGTEVKYTAVSDPNDVDTWTDVLEVLLGRDDVYGLVPLTHERTVLDLYAAHVDSMSSPEQGLWRVLWLGLTGIPEIPIVSTGSTVPNYTAATTADGELCKCIFEADPLSTDTTAYVIMRCPAGNGAFITNGVRAGDVVRALYVGDAWQEFVIDEIQSEDQVRLMTGPAAPQPVPAQIDIWRNLTATEEAAEIAKDAGSWGNRRVRAVWPDSIESSGTVQDGMFLCAALAGLSSGVLPHQSLTNVAVAGFSDASRSAKKFNRPQLDSMGGSGTWIVTQSLTDGTIYTRHAVTTGSYEDINQREEMLTRNVDSISYRFKDQFAPYIGITNVTPSMTALLRKEVDDLITVLQTERYTTQLGGQLISADIVRLEPHLTILDRMVLVLNCTVPYSLNNFEIHLVV